MKRHFFSALLNAYAALILVGAGLTATFVQGSSSSPSDMDSSLEEHIAHIFPQGLDFTDETKEWTFEDDELRDLFQDIQFDQKKVHVRRVPTVACKKTMEVHFHDARQIQETLDASISIHGKKVIYIQDRSAEEPLSYISPDPTDPIHHGQGILVEAAPHLRLKGAVRQPLEMSLFLPKESIWKDLDFQINGPLNFLSTVIGQKKNRKKLVNIINDFDQNLFDQRTRDAFDLKKISEKKSGLKFSVEEVFPELLVHSDQPLTFTCQKLICADSKRFAVIAPDQGAIETLRAQLPLNALCFDFIIPSIGKAGIYSQTPLLFEPVVRLETMGSLFTSGLMNSPEASIHIYAEKNLWQTASIKASPSIAICGKQKIRSMPFYRLLSSLENEDPVFFNSVKQYLLTKSGILLT